MQVLIHIFIHRGSWAPNVLLLKACAMWGISKRGEIGFVKRRRQKPRINISTRADVWSRRMLSMKNSWRSDLWAHWPYFFSYSSFLTMHLNQKSDEQCAKDASRGRFKLKHNVPLSAMKVN